MEFSGRLIYQGAESRVYESEYIDRPVIIKERLSKSYRVKELDKKINKHRLQQEIKCMVKCRRFGVATPRYINGLDLCMCIQHYLFRIVWLCSIYLIDSENNRLFLEKIIGLTLKDILWSNSSSSSSSTSCGEINDDRWI